MHVISVIFNLAIQIATLLTVFQVGLQLGGALWFGPVVFAGVLPRKQEHVVRESPMVPDWKSRRGFPAFCASLVLE